MPASRPCLPPFNLLPIPSRGGEYPVARYGKKYRFCGFLPQSKPDASLVYILWQCRESGNR